MKLSGKWTRAVAGACMMTVAGLSVTAIAGTLSRTNDNQMEAKIEAVMEDFGQELHPSRVSLQPNLLTVSNPIKQIDAYYGAVSAEEKNTEETKADQEVTDQEAADKEAADKEAADKEAADKEAADKQAADKKEVIENIKEESIEQETTAVQTSAAEDTASAEAKETAKSQMFMVHVEEYLNIRQEPSQEAEVLGKLYAGAGGTVLERGAEWTKIQSGSVTGYVATAYILLDEAAEAEAKAQGTWKVTVNTDSLRVRKEANTESGVWGLVSAGDTYQGTGEQGDFMGIIYEGETGYVAKEYVTSEFSIAQAISIEEEREQLRREEEARQAAEAERQRQEQEARAALERAEKENQFVETVQTSPYQVSESDAYLLACLVMAEAGYEPYEGKLAVANVVLNRLTGGYYGDTIADVVYAKGQFSVVPMGRLDKVLAEGPNSESVRAANEALSGVNNVPNYGFFCATYVANYSRYNQYSIIGNQVFYN